MSKTPIIFLFVAIGVGVYFFMKKSGNNCPDNCADTSCPGGKCKKCVSGYGTVANGKPGAEPPNSAAKDGTCPRQ